MAELDYLNRLFNGRRGQKICFKQANALIAQASHGQWSQQELFEAGYSDSGECRACGEKGHQADERWHGQSSPSANATAKPTPKPTITPKPKMRVSRRQMNGIS